MEKINEIFRLLEMKINSEKTKILVCARDQVLEVEV